MKILDRYILFTYLKSFASVFTILMLIFLLQSVWVYISELAGKDLEVEIILKFLLFVSPRLVVLVLPLTILLVSIMVFGNFSENYEFAAMKSTGISLQRAMKSLSFFIVFLAIISFFFANNVIPLAEYNFFNLRRNIARVKPAMVISEGQFNQLQDINIKVSKKSGENGKFLEDVIIHQKKGNTYGNYTVIKSKTGEFLSDESSDILQLILYDGNYYDELQPVNYQKRTKNRPQAKSAFDKYIINIDISQFNNVDFEQKDASSLYSMIGVVDLSIAIDSLYRLKEKTNELFAKKMILKSKQKNIIQNYANNSVDSLNKTQDVLSLFNTNKKVKLLEFGINSVKNIKQDLKVKSKSLQIATTNLNKHIIAFHDKFALGLMCIILFFVGAPLGALIRKGGIGLPMVIAILIFLTYHFISIFAKNSSEDNSLNPIFATWLAGIIMLPLSIYLTSRATKDRALIDLDSILIPLKKRLVTNSLITKEIKHKTETNNLNVSDKVFSEMEMKILGKFENKYFESGVRFIQDYHENATIGMVSHYIFLIFGIVSFILKKIDFEFISYLCLTVSIFAFVIFLIIFIKVFKSQKEFYKLLKVNFSSQNIIFIVLAIPVFFLYRIYFNKKMKEDLAKIT
ncbi:MAG: permease [Flavobacteriaceae bacterium]|nr:permease [Flavobacteriaceae bacterium]